MSMTTLFIPKDIKVGYQKRESTYTGKLGYVIYYDEKGKLRKENSWESWRHKNIDPDDYTNEPTSGFVLNKNVGGVTRYSSWYDHDRIEKTRVYDPRGFEFEITIPNLLWILENCDCIKGKGLIGDFVYAWDGTELVLLPTSAPEYAELTARNEIIHNKSYIPWRELKVGATYRRLDSSNVYTYLGKFTEYNVHSTPLLLATVNTLRLSALDLGMKPEEVFISGYPVTDWISDIQQKLATKKAADDSVRLKRMETELTKLLSDDKQVELQVDALAELFKQF